MTPTFERWSTERALKVMRAEHGDLDPRTWQAYGRALIAWGGKDRLATIAPRMPELSAAFPLARRKELLDAMQTGERVQGAPSLPDSAPTAPPSNGVVGLTVGFEGSEEAGMGVHNTCAEGNPVVVGLLERLRQIAGGGE